jgi:type VI protein secretion system component VasK
MLPILIAAAGPLLTGAVVWEAISQTEPWWIVAVVVPLAGFSAWLVRWILQKQDERDKANMEREKAREVREDKRQESFQQQVGVLSTIARELQLLNDNHKSLALARADDVSSLKQLIEKLPQQIVNKCNGT